MRSFLVMPVIEHNCDEHGPETMPLRPVNVENNYADLDRLIQSMNVLDYSAIEQGATVTYVVIGEAENGEPVYGLTREDVERAFDTAFANTYGITPPDVS